jgi:hypothetical protein
MPVWPRRLRQRSCSTPRPSWPRQLHKLKRSPLPQTRH